MREKIEAMLRQLGVTHASSQSDPYRWSVSDLATDLVALLSETAFCSQCLYPLRYTFDTREDNGKE